MTLSIGTRVHVRAGYFRDNAGYPTPDQAGTVVEYDAAYDTYGVHIDGRPSDHLQYAPVEAWIVLADAPADIPAWVGRTATNPDVAPACDHKTDCACDYWQAIEAGAPIGDEGESVPFVVIDHGQDADELAARRDPTDPRDVAYWMAQGMSRMVAESVVYSDCDIEYL